MKYLKYYENNKFEENWEERDPNIIRKENIVKSYENKYPNHNGFFSDFIEKFPSYIDFRNRLFDYLDEPENEDFYNDFIDDNGDYDDDAIFNELWNPESEIFMIESDFPNNYPKKSNNKSDYWFKSSNSNDNDNKLDTTIWEDFYNDLIETEWQNNQS